MIITNHSRIPRTKGIIFDILHRKNLEHLHIGENGISLRWIHRKIANILKHVKENYFSKRTLILKYNCVKCGVFFLKKYHLCHSERSEESPYRNQNSSLGDSSSDFSKFRLPVGSRRTQNDSQLEGFFLPVGLIFPIYFISHEGC